MDIVRRIAAAVALTVSVAACSVPAGALTGPRDCEAEFPAVRCSNMTHYAASKLHVQSDSIAGISVLPPPTPEVRDGVTILSTYGGASPVDTLVTLGDGSVHQVSMDCSGIPALQCRDDPRLEARSATMGGYSDLPCPGASPDGCATPVPLPDREALADAVGLNVARLDIPIDHDGHYEVPVGEATLPNGFLSVADFGFVSEAWPSDVTIADGIVRLEVRSLDDPTRAFVNVYEHGRVSGTERVEARLVFDVLNHDPGAMLSVRDLIVR